MAQLNDLANWRSWTWILAVSVTGCGAGSEFWTWPNLPEETRSIVVVAKSELGTWARAFVYSPEVPIELGDDAETVALFSYEEPLESIGLTVGPVERAQLGDCWARRLDFGTSVHSRGTGEASWTESSEAPAPFDEFLALTLCPCPRFEPAESFSLGADVPALRSRLFEARERLYLLSDGASFAWPRAGVSEGTTEPLMPNPIPLPIYDAFVAPDQTLWLASAFRIARVDLETGEVQTSTTLPVRAAGIAGGEADGELEIYVAADGSRVYRRALGVWSEVSYEAGIQIPDHDQTGRALWIAPGQAVLALHDARGVLVLDPALEPRLLSRDTFPSVSTLSFAPNQTTYAGSRTGPIGTVEVPEIEAATTFDPRLATAGEIRRLYPVADRLGFVSRDGYVGELVLRAGVCPLTPAPEFQEIYDGLGNEAETIVAGRDADGQLRITRYLRRL